MSKIRIQLLAATAAIATARLIGGTTAWASTTAHPHGQVTARPDTTIVGTGFGQGATAAKAEHAAQVDLVSNYNGCQLPPNLVYDTDSNGLWSAEVSATCQHIN